MSTLNETIKELQEIADQGYGEATIRKYTGQSPEPYEEMQFEIHKVEDNILNYYNMYGNWVECY